MTTDTLRYYDNNALALSKRYENAEVSNIWEKIGETFCNREKILEIGCGSGRDSMYMHETGCDIFAIDGSFRLIEQALKEHPELSGRLFQTILPCMLPFKDSMFDGVVSIACLMHFSPSQVIEILAEVNRVAKSKAKLIISIPAGRSDVLNGKDDNNRIFTLLPMKDWEELFLRVKLNTLDVQIKPDGLGRTGVEWATFTLQTM